MSKPGLDKQLAEYLVSYGDETAQKDYLVEAVNYGMNNSDMDFNENSSLLPVDLDWTDPDDEVLYDPDYLTVYQPYQDAQTWPNVNSVISYKNFVPNRFKPGTTKVEKCFVLAKEQLGKNGYTAGGYQLSQIFQTYTASSGTDMNQTKRAVTYLITKLSAGVPVLAGVDVRSGSPNEDNTTDHFIVIVGMGTDSKGRYFSFYNSSTNWPIYGASKENKLYYNSNTGRISGKTMSQYGSIQGHHDFVLTQVRKSILK
ncbi:hypothetical protein [Pedobacter aquatilis]|uniref:hypothetical protein n=1 Tax=Pedobacter aquatilis TaxID=351343 RepID=UPI0029315054|nr:hypothetical protein [Pedobacter aquatilis]